MQIDDKIYVNYIPTIGDFDTTQDGIATIGSGLTPGDTPKANAVPERNENVNEVIANRGKIGGWNIELNSLSNGRVFINADTGQILLGSDTTASASISIDSSDNTIRLGPTTGNYITLDGTNLRMRSSNYVANVSGFTVEPSLVEAENLVARGILKGATFQYDVVSAIGGQLMVANADVLDADMTAADSSTLTIKGSTTFSANDILVMRAVTASGIQEEWLRVTSAASAPTYSVTRDLAASFSANANPVWKTGTPVVKQGVSDGASTYSGGWLRLFGQGTNSPYYSVFARTGVAYNAYTEVARMGNLNGFIGYTSDLYGLAAGTSTDYFSYDPTNGVRVNTPVNVDISLTAGEALTIGEAVGLYGELLSTSSLITATKATYVDQNNATTNFDGTNPIQTNSTSNRDALLFFPGLGALEPSGTGITIIKWEVRFTLNITSVPAGSYTITFDDNTGSFNETTVTWNTKPATGGTSSWSPFSTGQHSTGVQTSGWGELTSTEYSNFKTNGVTFSNSSTENFYFSDEDQANPPKIEVRYTYKIRDGKAYKVKATTAEYANSFLGIAQATVAAAASVKIRTEGKDSNQSGLSATFGTTYYLSNTLGAISTSVGTKTFIVGRNLSTTELQVKYSLNQVVV